MAKRQVKRQLRVDGGEDELHEVDPDTHAGRPRKGTFHLDHDVPLIVSTGRLAAVLNLSERMVQKLKSSGMPQHARGRWDLESAIPWYVQHVEKRAAPEDGTMLEAQRRFYAARAVSAETLAARSTGQAVEMSEVRAMLADFAIAIRSAAESAPTRLYTDEQTQDTARQIAEQILADLAATAAHVGPGARDDRRAARAAAAT